MDTFYHHAMDATNITESMVDRHGGCVNVDIEIEVQGLGKWQM